MGADAHRFLRGNSLTQRREGAKQSFSLLRGFAPLREAAEKSALPASRGCEIFPGCMSEFKFACPVCGQHMMCDSSQGGSVMQCPTCFQPITAPQSPAPDAKFILTGTKVSEKRILVRGLDAAPGSAGARKNFPVATLIGVIVLALAGAGIFFFGGKLRQLVSPSPWRASDIGYVGTPGSFGRTNGVFTINGSGADVWLQADGLYYLFQPLDGDGALTAQVLNLKDTDLWAKAGVMIRETTAAGSKMAVAAVRPDGQAQFIWRNATGVDADASPTLGGLGYPKWVKIVRTGDAFSAFYKANPGDEWQQIIGPQTIHMATNVQIGLIVCAHKVGTLCQAQFDRVTLHTGKNAGLK
jgi:hypothetical protein